MVLDEGGLPSWPGSWVEGMVNLLSHSQCWGCPFEAQHQGWAARCPTQPVSASQLWCQVEFFRCRLWAAQTRQVFRRVQGSSQHQRGGGLSQGTGWQKGCLVLAGCQAAAARCPYPPSTHPSPKWARLTNGQTQPCPGPVRGKTERAKYLMSHGDKPMQWWWPKKSQVAITKIGAGVS